jgi:hypothetical protein
MMSQTFTVSFSVQQALPKKGGVSVKNTAEGLKAQMMNEIEILANIQDESAVFQEVSHIECKISLDAIELRISALYRSDSSGKEQAEATAKM